MPVYTVAIVGAGPAGYFSAQAFQLLSDQGKTFKVDLFEKLPTPWGLVRSGVAPDHPKIKTVSKVFERISDDPNFRLFANIEIGRDISLEALKASYDAVILAVGAPLGKKLGIPGEDLANCWSAAEFVSWYNGHPDFSNLSVDLSGERAIIIGAGNVALDIARLLSIKAGDLSTTDIADHALVALSSSRIKEVWLCARRGPEFASFTVPELRELAEFEDIRVSISSEEIKKAKLRAGPDADRRVKSNLELMDSLATDSKIATDRSLEFKFHFVPKKFKGVNKVEEVVFTTPNGEVEIAADLIVEAIGYSVDVKLDLSLEGNHFLNAGGLIGENLYVVGWAKRGPTGVIGTNRSDSSHVVKMVVDSLVKAIPKGDSLANELIESLDFLSLDEWRRINEYEIARGRENARPRVKVITTDEMIKIAKY